MSLVLDCEHAVGPSLLALLTQKILMWGPTVGVIVVLYYYIVYPLIIMLLYHHTIIILCYIENTLPALAIS